MSRTSSAKAVNPDGDPGFVTTAKYSASRKCAAGSGDARPWQPTAILLAIAAGGRRALAGPGAAAAASGLPGGQAVPRAIAVAGPQPAASVLTATNVMAAGIAFRGHDIRDCRGRPIT
jgi:hypothetical protein